MKLPRVASLSRDRQIELCERMRAGDTAAKDELYLSVLPWVRKLANRYPATIAEDVFQQAATELYAAMPRFDARKSKISAWAYNRVWWCAQRFRTRHLSVIVRPAKPCVRAEFHALIDAAGKVASLEFGRDRQLASRGNVGTSLIEPAIEDDLHLIDLSDELDRLRDALAKLNPVWRRVALGRAAGVTLVELAAELGISKQRVHQVERAAMAKLREVLGVSAESDDPAPSHG